jgi:GBP family porin
LNKKLIGLGMLLAANGAFAQSVSPTPTETPSSTSVELYGILDVDVGHIEKSLSTDPNFPFSVNPVSAVKTSVNTGATGMFNGGIQDSRWGIRGTEDLGGGLKAFFTLESGINVPTGNLNNGTQSIVDNSKASTVSANTSLNGELFNRQAFVGISDPTLGSIAAGRNYAPIYDIAVEYDPVQDANLFSPLGFSGTIGGGGGVSEDTRVDNSLKYKNKIGGFNFGVLYKFGGVACTTCNSEAESGYAANLGYENGPFGIQAAYEAFTDALKTTTSAVPGEIGVTDYNTTAFFVAAKYKFGQATIKAGYESYTLKAPSDSMTALGLTSLYGYQIASASSVTFASANQTTDVYFIGGDYNFTPSLNLALGWYDQNPKQSSDLKQLDGNIYSYSALLDYHFTKRTDVYFGFMYESFKGNNYPVATYDANNYITAIGLRVKF